MFIYFYEEYGKKEPIAEGPGGTHLDLFYGAAITCASFFSSAAFWQTHEDEVEVSVAQTARMGIFRFYPEPAGLIIMNGSCLVKTAAEYQSVRLCTAHSVARNYFSDLE